MHEPCSKCIHIREKVLEVWDRKTNHRESAGCRFQCIILHDLMMSDNFRYKIVSEMNLPHIEFWGEITSEFNMYMRMMGCKHFEPIDRSDQICAPNTLKIKLGTTITTIPVEEVDEKLRRSGVKKS